MMEQFQVHIRETNLELNLTMIKDEIFEAAFDSANQEIMDLALQWPPLDTRPFGNVSFVLYVF